MGRLFKARSAETAGVGSGVLGFGEFVSVGIVVVALQPIKIHVRLSRSIKRCIRDSVDDQNADSGSMSQSTGASQV